MRDWIKAAIVSVFGPRPGPRDTIDHWVRRARSAELALGQAQRSALEFARQRDNVQLRVDALQERIEAALQSAQSVSYLWNEYLSGKLTAARYFGAKLEELLSALRGEGKAQPAPHYVQQLVDEITREHAPELAKKFGATEEEIIEATPRAMVIPPRRED